MSDIGIHYSVYAYDDVSKSLRYLVRCVERIAFHEANKLYEKYDVVLHVDAFTLPILLDMCRSEHVSAEHVRFVTHPRNVGARGQMWRHACLYDDSHEIAIAAELDAQDVPFSWELEYMLKHEDCVLQFRSWASRAGVHTDFSSGRTVGAYNLCCRPRLIRQDVKKRFRDLHRLVCDNLECITHGIDEWVLTSFIFNNMRDVKTCAVVVINKGYADVVRRENPGETPFGVHERYLRGVFSDIDVIDISRYRAELARRGVMVGVASSYVNERAYRHVGLSRYVTVDGERKYFYKDSASDCSSAYHYHTAPYDESTLRKMILRMAVGVSVDAASAYGTTEALDPSDPGPAFVLSLTTHGKRFKDRTYETAILSALSDFDSRRVKVVLSVEEPDAAGMTARQKAFISAHGVELVVCKPGLGSHNKYVHAMRRHPDSFVVTIDDDVEYSGDMLKVLDEASKAHPGVILCGWGEAIARDGDGMVKMPPSVASMTSHPENAEQDRDDLILFGVGGVLYPPAFCRLVGEGHEDLIASTGTAHHDDVLLSMMYMRAGLKARVIRDVRSRSPRFGGRLIERFMPCGEDSTALHKTYNTSWSASADIVKLLERPR